MKRETRVAPDEMAREVIKVMKNRESMESRVTYRLVNKKNVRPDGDEICDPWKGDLVIVYRIDIDKEKTAIIGETVLHNQFNGDMDKVRRLARENTPRIHPPKFMGMMETIGIPMSEPETMYILTNKDQIGGATSILYPGIGNVIREKFKGAYYLIPSSIHELIIIPADGMEYEDLNEIIVQVNGTQVAELEQLGDKALYVTENNEIKGGF